MKVIPFRKSSFSLSFPWPVPSWVFVRYRNSFFLSGVPGQTRWNQRKRTKEKWSSFKTSWKFLSFFSFKKTVRKDLANRPSWKKKDQRNGPSMVLKPKKLLQTVSKKMKPVNTQLFSVLKESWIASKPTINRRSTIKNRLCDNFHLLTVTVSWKEKINSCGGWLTA